jgi:hypothetical protein
MAFSSRLRNRKSTCPRRGRAQHPRTAPRFRPRLEALQDRCLPSTLTVTYPGDGPVAGSLRSEIGAAHSGDTIVFAPGLKTINLGSPYGELCINKSLTIKGPGAGALTISAAASGSRLFEVYYGSVTLSGLTISQGNGMAGGSGDPWLPPANQGEGGGILNDLNGNLTISGCTISNNSAEQGGGIANFGALTLSQSTLSANSALGGLAVNGDGGGIYAKGRTATLSNCTLSNNRADRGGGLFLDTMRSGSTVTLTNCTLGGNLAGIGGGIDVVKSLGILNLTNTIVAGNTAGTGPDVYGAVATADHNLVGNATGSTGIVNGVNGNIVGGNGRPVINAELGPLQNNGGPTQTMALLVGSPAIGHADNTKAPATDQRGVTRVDEPGETTDIGAFEL